MMGISDRIKDEYRVPGSRYDRMMTLMERGACEEEFLDEIEGADKTLYRCMKAIADGTLSLGVQQGFHPMAAIKGELARKERREEIFRMLDDGLKAEEIQIRTGMSRGGIAAIRKCWAVARGLNIKRKKEKEDAS